MVSIPETPIDGGINHSDRNEETKLTVVSEAAGMVGVDRAFIAPRTKL